MGGSPGPGGSSAAAGAASVGARRAAVTMLLMNLASIVERADEGILPAVRRANGSNGRLHVARQHRMLLAFGAATLNLAKPQTP